MRAAILTKQILAKKMSHSCAGMGSIFRIVVIKIDLKISDQFRGNFKIQLRDKSGSVKD